MVYNCGYLPYSNSNFDRNDGIEQPRYVHSPWFECTISNPAYNS